MLKLYENIKQRRKEAGLTQEELARRTGYTDRSSIAKIEKGAVDLSQTKIKQFADALNTTPAALMGWEDALNSPGITDDVVTFDIIGDVAAGYNHFAAQEWEQDTVDIPRAYLHGRSANDFFALRVTGDSMYPLYMAGDVVLVRKQETLDRSGQIAVVLYDSEYGTIKKVEFTPGENWMKLLPVNPNYPPVTIRSTDLERCQVLGIPQLLIRAIDE